MSYAPAPYGFSYVPAAPGAAVTATDGPGAPHPWKESSFSFHDVLDALNPLQHIPIVNTIYRWATGDVPGNIARVVGDGLYGGPIGLAAGMLSVAVKDDTGKDPGEMVMGLLTGGDTAEVKLGSAAALPRLRPHPPRQALRPPPPCRPRRPFPRRAPRRVRAPRQRRP